MNREAMEDILECLEEIKKEGPASESDGICFNLNSAVQYETFDKVEKFLKKSFPKWKHFSGDIHYPVPSKERGSETAYFMESKWEGEYGKMRMKLVKFLIKTAKKKLK